MSFLKLFNYKEKVTIFPNGLQSRGTGGVVVFPAAVRPRPPGEIAPGGPREKLAADQGPLEEKRPGSTIQKSQPCLIFPPGRSVILTLSYNKAIKYITSNIFKLFINNDNFPNGTIFA